MVETVYLVGAGPGDPDLLTLRAAAILERAEVVFADDLVGLALRDRFCPGALWLPCRELGPSSQRQRRLHAMLIAYARSGKRVAHLKGGDPFVFGRLGEEAAALRAQGVPFVMVPGVSSASAAAAALGVPLTRRGVASGVSFLAGTRGRGEADDGALRPASLCDQTLAVFMGVSRLPEISHTLLEQGLDPLLPVAIVERASCPEERITLHRLSTLAETARRVGVHSPAMLLIGHVLDAVHPLPEPARSVPVPSSR